MENKKRLTAALKVIFSALLCICSVLVLYISSPLHPKNITDETVIQKGVEYNIKLSGISEYDETGFRIVTNGFFFTSEKTFVYKDEEGFAFTSYDGEGECYLLGEYNSPFVSYENYRFCGENYKSREELEKFFEEPDRIYDFDINKLSEYIQDVLAYKKHFYGKATVKIYKGRLVITDFYIGEEKVLEFKQ